MTTMKMKNGNQYKIQKSQNGGGNNANKNFMSRVEQRYIPNTISYLELFMNTIKIKDFCNRYQYEMQKAGMEEGIMPIKSLRAGWRRDTFQTQYPMWNCS